MTRFQTLILVIYLLLSGCSLIYNDHPPECLTDTDCPENEVCLNTLCVQESKARSGMGDSGVATTDSGTDGTVDLEQADSSTSDMMVPQERGPYADGLCYTDISPEDLMRSWTAPPRAFCNDWARGWLESSSEGHHFVYPNPLSDAGELITVSGVAWENPTFDEHYVYLPVLNGGDTQEINIYKHDLKSTNGRLQSRHFLRPSFRPQRTPIRGDGFTAFLQTTEKGRERVYIAQDDGDSYPCDQNGNGDTHSSLTASGAWVAWLEMPPNSQCANIVLSKSNQCTALVNQARWDLTGTITTQDPTQPALHGTRDAILWLETDVPCRSGLISSSKTQVKVWFYSRAERPRQLQMKPAIDGQPIQLVTHPKHTAVAIVTWNRGPRGLYLVDIETGQTRMIETTGLIAHPFLSEKYLIWAEQSENDGTWEVRYEQRP